jgi:hypothetical protein
MTIGRIALAGWILSVLFAWAIFWCARRRLRVSSAERIGTTKQIEARKELARILADQSDEVLLRLGLSDGVLEEIAKLKQLKAAGKS